jgi:hypothetical protein
MKTAVSTSLSYRAMESFKECTGISHSLTECYPSGQYGDYTWWLQQPILIHTTMPRTKLPSDLNLYSCIVLCLGVDKIIFKWLIQDLIL